MEEITTLGDSFDSLLLGLKDDIAAARREWSAGLFCAYPGRDFLKEVADEVRDGVQADFVEVNAIYQDRQITLTAAPVPHNNDVPQDGGSLCVLTVGLNRPVMIQDAQGSTDFLKAHRVVGDGLGSWASVPVIIEGEPAGTICAIQLEARPWSEEAEAELQRAAAAISSNVERWLQSS